MMSATRPRACTAIEARVNLASSPTPESPGAASARAGPSASALVEVSALLSIVEPQMERSCANSEVEKEDVKSPLPGMRFVAVLKNGYRRVKRVPQQKIVLCSCSVQRPRYTQNLVRVLVLCCTY